MCEANAAHRHTTPHVFNRRLVSFSFERAQFRVFQLIVYSPQYLFSATKKYGEHISKREYLLFVLALTGILLQSYLCVSPTLAHSAVLLQVLTSKHSSPSFLTFIILFCELFLQQKNLRHSRRVVEISNEITRKPIKSIRILLKTCTE